MPRGRRKTDNSASQYAAILGHAQEIVQLATEGQSVIGKTQKSPELIQIESHLQTYPLFQQTTLNYIKERMADAQKMGFLEKYKSIHEIPSGKKRTESGGEADSQIVNTMREVIK